MTDSEILEIQGKYIEQLEARITRLERRYEAFLRLEWNRRGQAKGEASKIEKELEVEWQNYLNRAKIGAGETA